MKTFIKVSGDAVLKSNERLLCEIIKWSLTEGETVVMCIGGGTQITSTIRNYKFGKLGREIQGSIDQKIAEKILRQNAKYATKEMNLIKREWFRQSRASNNTTIISPIIKVGGIKCLINGDQLALASYHGFDKIFIITSDSRLNKKKRVFQPYGKIEVIPFSKFL